MSALVYRDIKKRRHIIMLLDISLWLRNLGQRGTSASRYRLLFKREFHFCNFLHSVPSTPYYG